MKMSKYFADARNTANANFNSMNGGESYLNANGGSSAGMGGSTSQPYIIDLENTSGAAVANVPIGNAYGVVNSTALGIPTGVVVSMGIGSQTYVAFLNQSMIQSFVVGLTYVYSAVAAQVLQTLTIKQQDANGNESSKTIVPTIDPYQFNANNIAISFNWKFDGYTTLTIASIAATTTVRISLYPAETVNPSRNLTGNESVQGYSSPNIVHANASSSFSGANGGERAAARPTSRRRTSRR